MIEGAHGVRDVKERNRQPVPPQQRRKPHDGGGKTARRH
jgi:hypothetical protein